MNMVRGSYRVVASCVLLVLGGCAPSKPARMIMPFAPPTPAKSSDVTIPDPPALPPNLYLSNDTPNAILDRLASPPTSSDLLMARADEAYQRGKRFYQSGDRERARLQF